MPVTFASFGIAALAISGIPPFNGFVSKWMVYQGLIEAGIERYWLFLVAAMFGSALTLASFVKVGHAVFLGERPRELAGVTEAEPSMRFSYVVLATLCIVFGIAAQVPLLHFIGPAVGLEFPAFPAALEGIGLWSPTLGTVLLLLSLLVGYVVYLSSRTRTVRMVPEYIGGETSGEGTSESLSTGYARRRETADTRVLGTEFYDNVRQLPGLSTLYDLGEARKFDIERLARLAPPVGRAFSALHTGRLSTYASWIVWAAIVLAIVFVLAAR
jgi:NADH:ubiquinone oxidoreductase subunit 5 (subunit L)/multisubunit Na+/H+ antiporter MnhA subunit